MIIFGAYKGNIFVIVMHQNLFYYCEYTHLTFFADDISFYAPPRIQTQELKSYAKDNVEGWGTIDTPDWIIF